SMAHTKQTAKKTTGGMGPCQQLTQQCKNMPTMTVTKAAGTAKKCLAHKAKASGGRASQIPLLDDNQPMTVDEDIEGMPQQSSSLPLMTPSPVQGSSALPPASADDAKSDARFHFSCFEKTSSDNFPVMNSHIEMTAGSQVNCELLLIIHFYCKGMDLQGSLPQAITDYLWLYFWPGDLQFLQSEFNFATHAKINMHREKMKLLREGICRVLPSHMVIFISMHSDEECGDLFAGQEGPETKPRTIAVNMDHFFSLLFESRMDCFLDGATLVLLTCGWLVKHEGSFNELHSSLCQ
ncbi:hypothetical protein PAXRUDRAFT_170510, partial [Paxillus rubicundulus Ve08.2h10]